MKLKDTGQLLQHLNPLAAAYLISGDEPLLLQEAGDLVRQAARQQGFEERQVFHAEGNFNWQNVLDEANALSLFASRKILEIRLTTKPSDKGAAIKALLDNPSADNLILIVSPRLDANTQKTAWVKALEKTGVWLPLWPIDKSRYPDWLKQRSQKLRLTLQPAALSLLAQQTEGNLLAAVQELEKLKLLGLKSIELETLEQAIGNSARFDTFSLIDTCLLGDLAAAIRMLNGLKAEGTEAILILGAMLHKIHQLINLKSIAAQDLDQAFRRQGIWPNQQAPFKHALRALSRAQLYQSLKIAEEIDQAIKGSGDNPWRLLQELLILLSGQSLLKPTLFS